MKPVRYLLLAILFGTLSLTACDSNNESDDDIVVDVITETETETVVSANDPVVAATNNEIASTFQAVVGPNVVVSTAAGSVTKVTTTSTSSTGQTTTTSLTIAPLVDTTTGQPTGQVAVVTTTGNTSTTKVAGLTNTSATSPTLGVTSSDGTRSSFPFNATFTASPASIVQGSNAADKAGITAYNQLLAKNPNLTTTWKFSDGKTAKVAFEEAFAAPGKSAGLSALAARIARFALKIRNNRAGAVARAISLCSANGSAATFVDVTYPGGTGNISIRYTCSTGTAVLL